MNAKEKLHHLIEQLSEPELTSVVDFVEYLNTRAQRRLPPLLANAPLDDEPLTIEDRLAWQEAEADASAGRVVSLESLEEELGLS